MKFKVNKMPIFKVERGVHKSKVNKLKTIELGIKPVKSSAQKQYRKLQKMQKKSAETAKMKELDIIMIVNDDKCNRIKE